MRQIRSRIHFLILTACLLGLEASSTAFAQAPDHRTIFTFSQSVTVPGKVLPAGTYEFVTADISDRQVVQVFESGGNKLVTTLFATPVVRPDRPETTQVRFLEVATGEPPALQSWWNAGMTTGYELVYPTEQARLLAKSNPRGVMSAANDKSEMKRTVMPAVEETPTAAPAETPVSLTEAPRVIPTRTSLPKTASSRAAWPIAGFVLLAVAAVSIAARRAR